MRDFVCFPYFNHPLYLGSKYFPDWRKPEIAFFILGRFPKDSIKSDLEIMCLIYYYMVLMIYSKILFRGPVNLRTNFMSLESSPFYLSNILRSLKSTNMHKIWLLSSGKALGKIG